MKKSRVMLVVCCVIALVATVTVSFAVWDSVLAGDETIQANFGKNVKVELINNNTFTNAGKYLVPKDAICGSSDTQQYVGASFTVKLLDFDSKSTLKFTLKVISDGNLDVSQYFDLSFTTNTENATITLDEQFLKNGEFVGQITVPPTVANENDVIVPGSANFTMNMAFKQDASTMQGIEQIIGRVFKIKIDILAQTKG